jgi:hypothetical protein
MSNILQIIKLSPFQIMKYPIYVIGKIIFTLLAWILSPFLAAYSVIKNVNVLPGYWQYFSTTDDDLDGGQHQQPEIYPSGVTGFKLWWQRTCWICRNPSGGFDGLLFGFKTDGYKVIWENQPVASIGWTTGGCLYANVMEDAKGNRFFTYRANISIGSKRYLKIWFGWNYMAYDKVYHQVEFQPGSLKTIKGA